MLDTAGAQVTEPTAQAVPFKKAEDGAADVLVRVVGALILVVLVGFGAVFLLKRYLPVFYHPSFSGASRIKVVEIRRITPKATLFLIELDDARLLLGQSGDHLAKLYEFPKSASAGDRET